MAHGNSTIRTGTAFDASAFKIHDTPQERTDAAFLAALAMQEVPAPRTTADRVLELARSSGIYSGQPAPDALSPAQRRAIERELALKMTAHIDWKQALGPDPGNPAAVYYDGYTLRNASHLTTEEAAAAMEHRIRDRLGARPGGPFDYLVRPLRDSLIGGPTLSREPGYHRA